MPSDSSPSKKGLMGRSLLAWLAAMSVVITLGLSAGGARASHGNTLSASPDSGPPGTKVTLSGTGWTPNNGAYVIFWGSLQGPQLGTFSPDGQGGWSTQVTIPQNAQPGGYNIIACEGYGGEFQDCVATPFKVTLPPPTPTLTPTPTSTPLPPPPEPIPADETAVVTQNAFCRRGPSTAYPTVTAFEAGTLLNLEGRNQDSTWWWALVPGTTAHCWISGSLLDFDVTPEVPVTVPPVVTLPPPVVEVPIPEGWCADLGLGPEAVVIDFEGAELATLEERYSVFFEGSGYVVTPLVDTRSPTHALRGAVGEFLVGRPISVVFGEAVSAVGVFVGREQADYHPGEFTAELWVSGVVGETGVRWDEVDRVRLPAGPAPVRYCLRVEAPEGVAIDRAEITFFDDEGVVIDDPPLIDDLTFVPLSGVEVEDRPPVVRIVDPGDGTTVSSRQRFDVSIEEDRALRRVWYQVDGGEQLDTWFARRAEGFVSGASIALTSGRHTVTFGAEDISGQVGTDTITVFVPTPPPPVDIEAVALEVVQVVQCMGGDPCRDNSVPILEGKPTLVRLYVRLNSGDLAGRSVRGQLCRAFGRCIRSMNRVVPDNDPDPVSSDRGDLNATLNFLLPADWIEPGLLLQLQAEVNPLPSPVEETDRTNNGLVANIRPRTARVMKVNFVPVRVGSATAPLSERTNMADWLARAFPVSRIQIIGAGSTMPLTVSSLSDTSGGGCGKDWNAMMAALGARRAMDIGNGLVGDDVHYLGMVPQGVDTGGILGCGYTPGWVATSIITPGQRFGGEVAAQELAHNKGLRHAPGCGAGGVDPSYPVASGTLDVWGIDVGRFQIYQPSSTFDYMGYCGSENDTWTSRYTYLNMMRLLPRALESPEGARLMARARQEEPQEYLVVGGVAYPQVVDVVTGPYRMQMRRPDDTPAGPYTVELLDAQGNALYSREFRATPLSNDDTPDVGTFFLTLPALEGTQAIRFLYQGEEITRLEASPGAPTVEILSPVGGEDWGSEGTQTIRWQAQDPEGDPLRFTVQASEDGERWITLALDLKDTDSFDLNVADLAGGSYFIRVLATDGFNTAEARTQAPVTVGRKPPTVALTAPEDGAVFPRGEMVVVQGFATDLEDGEVPEEAYLWTSSIDGELGTGSTLWALELSPGEHEITLTVTDQDGMSASESVRITVLGEEEEAEAAGEAPQGPEVGTPPLPALLVLAGLALLALAGLGLIVLALRRRSGA